MPYLFIALGLVLGGVFLTRLHAQARKTGDYSAILAVILIAGSGAALLLVLMGRWPVAGILIAIMAYAILRLRPKRGKSPRGEGEAGNRNGTMTREEALAVLGLPPEASQEEISRAYKTLMEKVHPDHEGSTWMAAKLNQARDALTRNNQKNG